MPKKHIDNRRVKRTRSKDSGKRFTFAFLLGFSLVLGMIFSGWVRWKQTEIVYRINKLGEQKEVLLEERKEKLMELHKFQSPRWVEETAREQLGYIDVEPMRIIWVEVPEIQMDTRSASGAIQDNSSSAGSNGGGAQ